MSEPTPNNKRTEHLVPALRRAHSKPSSRSSCPFSGSSAGAATSRRRGGLCRSHMSHLKRRTSLRAALLAPRARRRR
eukprot:3915018-Lingulodinium_polyedra.AAC.1